uniref:Uncharacterized protein n=1 Tax=Brassica oleracea TaxID=3712 RepID=A0A3P6GW84_BRAOL|nr:unnamed protein product [Brassica oleracea]
MFIGFNIMIRLLRVNPYDTESSHTSIAEWTRESAWFEIKKGMDPQ